MADTTPTPVDLTALSKAAKAVEDAQDARRKAALAALQSGATIRAVASAAHVAVNTLLKWRAEDK